jgi:hypothetical protein
MGLAFAELHSTLDVVNEKRLGGGPMPGEEDD